jgi:hypothetical protein
MTLIITLSTIDDDILVKYLNGLNKCGENFYIYTW